MAVDETEKLFGDAKIPTKVMIARLWKYLKPVLWRFIVAFIFILINVGFDVALPMIVGKFTETIENVENATIYLILSYFVATIVTGILLIHAAVFPVSFIYRRNNTRLFSTSTP